MKESVRGQERGRKKKRGGSVVRERERKEKTERSREMAAGKRRKTAVSEKDMTSNKYTEHPQRQSGIRRWGKQRDKTV